MTKHPLHVSRAEFFISTDSQKLDLNTIHGFLTNAYWSPGISKDRVTRAVENSLCFGLYAPSARLIGFARVLTDFVHTAHLADVFVLPEFRGQGLGKWLIETVLGHPDLQGLRRFTLATRDAHEFYAAVGFVPLEHPERFMQLQPKAPGFESIEYSSN